ncbi:uncharacterized protein HKW66_Vig0220490 [Vigna angularis]|uniref:Uncharacterized protein n=1 Tax=Phaseolus angularis TaxID=3914 RepID=A0A8T0K4A7_PHAAN|nr:uncharacterized protein LOC108338208 isoform X1 [Vigna angularis]XP_052736127.1 uncharacterized protein LOC108338208 isoform X1 [Vigna angularis]KAG2390545.1 uncharacterized protein HKW66_Vig0220490 [Vigna angularis]
MDKARNVRRGSSVFSSTNKRRHKHKHKHNLLAVFSRGDLRFSEKLKKEKVRSLSAVGTASTSFQMSCHVSQQQQQQQTRDSSSALIATTKRFKLHRNFFNDCNGASVPRKLRSATKKRGRESMLLDSEKVKNKVDGIESLKKDSVKKSKKQGIRRQWTPREVVSGPITKDEEEVAETLYALAGMFPDNGSNHNNKELEGESLPDNSSVLQNLEDNASAALALEDSILASATIQGASAYGHESSPLEASKKSCLNEDVGQEQQQPAFPESTTPLMPSHGTSRTINNQNMPSVIVKSENGNRVALHDSELSLAMGLNMPRQSRISQVERKPHVEFEAREVDCKQQHMIKEQKGNEGLALWPGLSPLAPTSQAYLQSSAIKAPDWLEAAIRASKLDLMETSACSSSGRVFIPKRSWKKCAAHIHISHIIKSLEMPKRQVIKETRLFDCHQPRAHEGSKRGVLLQAHSLNGMKNGVTSTVTNPNESKNIILQQQCHYREISQSAPTPVVYGPQKQNFNFLSLSAGSNGLKADNNNNNNKIGSRLEPLSKLQMPYFQSLAQQHGVVMPIPVAQSQYASTSFLDQLSVAGPQVRLQQPHYFGNPLCGTNYSSTLSHKPDHRSFWGLQQAEQSRSTVNFNIMRTQFPNWQSARHDSSAMNPCSQAILPCSSASQDTLGSKISSIPAQQKQLLAPFQDKWTRPSSSPFII